MTNTTFFNNVHGAEEFYIDFVSSTDNNQLRSHSRRNIPVLASTVQKTKSWIGELAKELQWDDAQKTYHGLRAVLHVLRDRLTIHETVDFAAQLPMLVRGMFYEGWQPDQVPLKDRTRDAFLKHISDAFPDDRSVDPEQLTHAVLKVVRLHVSQGELTDIRAILPKPLGELLFGPVLLTE